ncbi:MAG: hypothetical protein MR031_05365 [Tenericutes bacterium]|nr:hypothetical protein [Mycoplasmatota bacterium]
MNIKNKLQVLGLSFLLLLPVNTLAYSNYVITGGETIGIEVNSLGIMVVGFYDVNNKSIAKDAGFMIGDRILEVNGNEVSNINEMINNVGEETDFTVVRDSKIKHIKLKSDRDASGILKTGLYVKDRISGIGTLTYIDPESKVFGALGHEILETTTITKFEIKDGKIYDATVNEIVKSRNGRAGEKSARYDRNNLEGTVNKNETSGIYGIYQEDFTDREKMKVGKVSEIKLGEALIRTVVHDNEIEDFEINILNINKDSETKNILFEVVSPTLLELTGGIVQGMSGSPIIQDDKIIGAVNYVIVNDTAKGYGIFITTMLEEGDK